MNAGLRSFRLLAIAAMAMPAISGAGDLPRRGAGQPPASPEVPAARATVTSRPSTRAAMPVAPTPPVTLNLDTVLDSDPGPAATGAVAATPDTGGAHEEPGHAIEPPHSVLSGESHHRPPVQMSAEATPVDYDASLFGPDPSYEDKPYDPEAQYAIYGGKRAVIGPRPALELGYKMYQAGPLAPDLTGITGEKNPARPQLLVYGDFRTAVAYNDLGAVDTAQAAARLNLDVDLRLTSTERFHAFFRPLDRDGRFTRYEFGGSQRDLPGNDDSELLLNMIAKTAFFEGDLGNIVSGLSDRYTRWDLPFAVGLVPLFFQNGIWADDAFFGAAATLPAKNSAALDISNMDVTFFVGLDEVSSKALPDANGNLDEHDGNLYGVAAFIERREAYFEGGYAYVHDSDDAGGDFSYHNLTASVTKRYAGKLSNSMRVLFNFGQEPGAGVSKTADGYLLLVENSLITHLPYTLVPYANFFYGNGRPQSLARDAGAGGPLKNTGINFETDGLTGFPLIDDNGRNAYGGAIGLQYLFNLDQQLVFELAMVEPKGDDAGRALQGRQTAYGVRYQRPLSKQWIVRTDAMWADREGLDDVSGVRLELRCKF